MAVVIFRVPAIYLSDKATEEHKKVYNIFKDKADKINEFNQDLAFILPSECDPETRKYLFDIEVKGV